jgi:molybdopterin molybdotransferase
VSFDTVVMVDWSGGNDRGAAPKQDAIWAAVVREGAALPSHYLRNRQVAAAWLAELCTLELAAGRRVFIGFDFPFGYPAGFAQHLVGRPDPLALWDWMALHLHDGPKANNRFVVAAQINARFPGIGPFWFNAGKVDYPDLPRKGRARHAHGMAEKRRCEHHAKGAFTCWQLGGAGSVGSQAMTGMAVLARLRTQFPRQISVWPFEPLRGAIALVEVWPSLYAADVRAAMRPGDIKDEVQVRLLAQRIVAMQGAGTLGAALEAVPMAARIEEGWIFGVSADD